LPILTDPRIDESKNLFPQVTIDSGIDIMKDFFNNWSSSVELREVDGDVIMDKDLLVEEQLHGLKQHLDIIRPQIESNPWLRTIITSL